MTDLREMLVDIADEAKYYGNVDRAVHVLRRRRRMARLVQSGAVAVVVLGVGLASFLVRPAAENPTITPDPGAPKGALSWLPGTLTVPSAKPPALPTDHGIGRASLLYQVSTPGVPPTTPLPGGDKSTPYLVATDGQQYQLPVGVHLGLSPDGRWLVAVRGERIVLRDLTGTATTDLGVDHDGILAVVWSTDGSRLAFRSDDGRHATVVELPSAASHTVVVPAIRASRLCGVHSAGDLVLCALEPAANHVETWVFDGRTGEQRSHLNADLSKTLTPAERQAESINHSLGFTTWPLGDTQLVIRTSQYAASLGVTVPADLLVLDLSDGSVDQRVSLPAETPGQPRPQSGGYVFTVTPGRAVIADLPVGLLLARFGPRGTGPDALIRVVRGVELLDPRSGDRSTVTTVSGDVAWLIVRGGSVD